MKRIVFAIPSYHRPDRQPFVKYLAKLGVPREDIVVTVQNDEDRAAYQKWNALCRVEGANGVGVSFNRNQCLRVEPSARLVMVDDGVRGLCVKQPNGKCESVKTRERLYAMLDKMFAYCEAKRVSVFSLNNSSMGLCASGVDFIDHPYVSIFMGIIDRRVQFDTRVKFLEDIERNLRVLKGGGIRCDSPMRSQSYNTAPTGDRARCTKTLAWTPQRRRTSPHSTRRACRCRSRTGSTACQSLAELTAR